MNKRIRYLSYFRLLLVLFVVFAGLTLSAEIARADALCVKTVIGAPSLDGVVAPGTATATCTSDAIWSGVAPAQYVPAVATGGAGAGSLFVALNDNGGANQHLYLGVTFANDIDVSEYDRVSFFFDANNNNAWDNGVDFAIVISVSPNTSLINTGFNCNLNSGSVVYYDRVTGGWSPNTAASALVHAKYAYDYSTVDDAETNIWNLEIDLPIRPASLSSAFNLTTTGDYFGMGTYIFKDVGHSQTQSGTVFKWPSTISTAAPIGISDSDPSFSEPSSPSQLADMSLNDICYDVRVTGADISNPWAINGANAAEGDHRIIRGAVNRFRITYYFDGPGTIPVPIVNPGDVSLGLTPYRFSAVGAQWLTSHPVGTIPYNANQTHSVEFTYDFGNNNGPLGDVSTLNFVCAQLMLQNFALDGDLSNNELHVNYNHFTTSEYTQSVMLDGSAIPGLKPGERATVFLQATMNNEQPDLRVVPDNQMNALQDNLGLIISAGSTPARLLLLLPIGGLVFILIGLIFQRTQRVRGLVFGIIGLALLVVGIFLLAPEMHKVDTKRFTASRWAITNGAEAGLEPVEDRPGWYQTTIAANEVRRLDLRFEGQPLPYQPQPFEFSQFVNDGTPEKVTMKVTPGSVASVIAFADIDTDGPDGPLPASSADGLIASKSDQETQYLLTSGYYVPDEYAGALIGSFNGGENWFVIGSNLSFQVPEEATELTLAINATLDAYRRGLVEGKLSGFIIETPPPQVPTQASNQGDATYLVPPTYHVWDTLTSLNLYSYVQTDVVRNGSVVAHTEDPWGEAHFSIYNVHSS